MTGVDGGQLIAGGISWRQYLSGGMKVSAAAASKAQIARRKAGVFVRYNGSGENARRKHGRKSKISRLKRRHR